MYLGKRYQLQGPIGRFGMATLYHGVDTHMKKTVTIKVLRDTYSTNPNFVERFEREAKIMLTLQHPNIVQVYDYGQTDGEYFIVMELVEGTDLRRYLRPRGVLEIDRAVMIAREVALGLGFAHDRGIVFGDLKPQNILIGLEYNIKVAMGSTFGTIQYYAPEQAQGETITPATDVYALGIVMYEMLTGHTPFDGDTPVAVAIQHIQAMPKLPSNFNPNFPKALEAIIMKCLEKAPDKRFRNGTELAKALE